MLLSDDGLSVSDLIHTEWIDRIQFLRYVPDHGRNNNRLAFSYPSLSNTVDNNNNDKHYNIAACTRGKGRGPGAIPAKVSPVSYRVIRLKYKTLIMILTTITVFQNIF